MDSQQSEEVSSVHKDEPQCEGESEDLLNNDNSATSSSNSSPEINASDNDDNDVEGNIDDTEWWNDDVW